MAKVDMSMVPAEFVSESGRYKPGNDAKHVSALLTVLKVDAKNSKDGKIKITALRESQRGLPTQHLKEKLANAVERFNNPPAKKERPKAEKEAKPAKEAAPEAHAEAEPVDASAIVRTEERQDVKVGRWHFPARTAFLEDGTEQIQRNSARDGSGEWVVFSA